MENRIFPSWRQPHNMLMYVVVLGVSLSLAIRAQERLGLVGRHCGKPCAYDRPSRAQVLPGGVVATMYYTMEGRGAARTGD